MATGRPDAARRRATERPMPLPAPVTRAEMPAGRRGRLSAPLVGGALTWPLPLPGERDVARSWHEKSAVGMHDLARHPGGAGAEQEHRRPGDVFRGADP